MRGAPEATLVAPSRLHLGLLDLGRGTRRYGGAGLMIASPAWSIDWHRSSAFQVDGLHATRARSAAEMWAEAQGQALPDCRVAIREAPPAHVGLGSGTQLALALAIGLHRWTGVPLPAPEALARSVGRGRRSAVGTYGCLMGGLIVERGRDPDSGDSPLDGRFDVPASWRFVLMRPATSPGLSGEEERRAFQDLETAPSRDAEALRELLRLRLVPALLNESFDDFSSAVFEYGYRSGLAFAPVQGGPFRNDVVENLVNLVRRLGVQGVGQSSWGPTVFAVTKDQAHAKTLVRQVRRQWTGDLDIDVAAANNRGVQWCLVDDSGNAPGV